MATQLVNTREAFHYGQHIIDRNGTGWIVWEEQLDDENHDVMVFNRFGAVTVIPAWQLTVNKKEKENAAR